MSSISLTSMASMSSGPDSDVLESISNACEGYDYVFVPPLGANYECPICLSVLKEPRQTQCGHRFCRGCIFGWMREGKKLCPVDNDVLLESQIFPDNCIKREILSATVKCPNHEEGCVELMTIRQIEKHLEHCLLSLVPCPLHCPCILLRRDLEDHLKYQCCNRTDTCQNCGEEMPASMLADHKTKCPKEKLQCSFCGIELLREKVAHHVKHECKNVTIPCSFHLMGCNKSFTRDQEGIHLSAEIPGHLKMLATSFNALSESFSNLSTGLRQVNKNQAGNDSGDSDLQNNEADCDNDLVNSHPPSADTLQPGGISQFASSLCDLCTHQQNILDRQQVVIADLQSKLSVAEHCLKQLEGDSLIKASQNTCGDFYWTIENFAVCKEKALREETSILHSPPFFSSPWGYKLCLRVNFNGSFNSQGEHYVSLFVHFMQGSNDHLLNWPFAGQIVLSIIDQRPSCKDRRHAAETLKARPDIAAFQKPTSARNHKGFGYTDFISLDVLDNGTFIRDDSLIIRAQVFPSSS